MIVFGMMKTLKEYIKKEPNVLTLLTKKNQKVPQIYEAGGWGARVPWFEIRTGHHDLSSSFCLLSFILLFLPTEETKKQKTKQNKTRLS